VWAGSILEVRAAPARDRYERFRIASAAEEQMKRCARVEMRVQAKRIETGAIESMWHTASDAFDVAGPEGSAGLEDCGESPCLACARQAIFERASEWQGRRSAVARMNSASTLKGVKRCARVGTARPVEADRKRRSHAEAMKRNARKATACVTKSRTKNSSGVIRERTSLEAASSTSGMKIFETRELGGFYRVRRCWA